MPGLLELQKPTKFNRFQLESSLPVLGYRRGPPTTLDSDPAGLMPSTQDVEGKAALLVHNPYERTACIERHLHNIHGVGKNDVHCTRMYDALSCKRSAILQAMTDDERHAIADQCKAMHVGEGGVIIAQGTTAECMYVIISGGFRILRDFSGQSQQTHAVLEL